MRVPWDIKQLVNIFIIKIEKHLEELEKSNEWHRTILQTAMDGVWLINKEGEILEVSETYCQMSGYSNEELTKMRVSDLEVIEKDKEVLAHIQKIIELGQDRFETKHQHKDGTVFDVEISTRCQDIKEGLLVSFLRNITSQKKAEDERLRMKKLESIGLLAGGIAHDFNNLLSPIMGNASMITLVDDVEKARALAKEIVKAVERAADLTNKLRFFSQDTPLEKRVESISKIIRETAEFSLGKNSNCKCKLDLDNNLWSAYIEPGQISQVIQNLVINARDAMPKGGVIKIKAKNIRLPAKNIFNLKAGIFIHLLVADSGIGIPKENLAKIFDPYFTTKQKEGGSGFGLAIVNSVVKNHNGIVDVESELGKGTTFHIFLPATDEKVAKKTIINSNFISRKLRVLIMDDEEAIRDVAQEMILALGHEAETSRNGKETLEKYSLAMEQGRPFDLVILDITIPGGIGGKETLQKLREINPEIKAIISSGYSTETDRDGFENYLPKPYTINSLRNIIEKIFHSE